MGGALAGKEALQARLSHKLGRSRMAPEVIVSVYRWCPGTEQPLDAGSRFHLKLEFLLGQLLFHRPGADDGHRRQIGETGQEGFIPDAEEGIRLGIEDLDDPRHFTPIHDRHPQQGACAESRGIIGGSTKTRVLLDIIDSDGPPPLPWGSRLFRKS